MRGRLVSASSLTALVGCSLIYAYDPGEAPGQLPDAGEPSFLEAGDSKARGPDASAAPPDDSAALDPYALAVLADSPALYFRLDESESASPLRSVVNDGGGVLNGGGTLRQPPAIRVGSALGFGARGTVTVMDSNAGRFAGRAPFTVEVWLGPGSLDGYRLILHRHDGADGWGLAQYTNSAGLRRGSDHCYFADGDALAAVGTYRHVVATYDGTWTRLYIDGRPSNSCQQTNAIAMPEGELLELAGDKGDMFDEVAIYDRALTADRIAAHFAAR